MKVIFIAGVSCSGKTQLANKLLEEGNLEYIDIDSKFNYNLSGSIADKNFLEELPIDKNIIIDGIPYKVIWVDVSTYTYTLNYDVFLEYCSQNNVEIIFTYCSDKRTYFRRYREKFKLHNWKETALTKIYDHFINCYFNLLQQCVTKKINIKYYDSFISEFTNYNTAIEKLGWIKLLKDFSILKKEYYMDVEEFKKEFGGGLNNYQDIELIDFIGVGKSYEEWDIIKDWFNWNKKTVADFSCWYGYFSFKINGLGGLVTGFDVADSILDIAKILNKAYNRTVEFKIWKAGQPLNSNYDVAICLDCFQYYDKESFLKNINIKTIIFDVYKNDVDIINKYYTIIRKQDSPRGNKIILLCERK